MQIMNEDGKFVAISGKRTFAYLNVVDELTIGGRSYGWLESDEPHAEKQTNPITHLCLYFLACSCCFRLEEADHLVRGEDESAEVRKVGAEIVEELDFIGARLRA